MHLQNFNVNSAKQYFTKISSQTQNGTFHILYSRQTIKQDSLRIRRKSLNRTHEFMILEFIKRKRMNRGRRESRSSVAINNRVYLERISKICHGTRNPTRGVHLLNQASFFFAIFPMEYNWKMGGRCQGFRQSWCPLIRAVKRQHGGFMVESKEGEYRTLFGGVCRGVRRTELRRIWKRRCGGVRVMGLFWV